MAINPKYNVKINWRGFPGIFYKIIQSLQKSWNNKSEFTEVLNKKELNKKLSKKDIKSLINDKNELKNIDWIFKNKIK